LRHGLEIAEWLVDLDGDAEIGGDAPDVRRRAIEGQQVAFHNLDPVETDRGGGFQLIGQRAAERHGGDRLAQRTYALGTYALGTYVLAWFKQG